MNPPLRISVVVPAYNAAATLSEQLAALVEQTFDGAWEIVVVDNASTDETSAIVREWADRVERPEIRLVSSTDGSGPSHARNVGIEAARAPKIACTDADDVAGQGWLDAMSRALDHHHFVAGALELDRLNPPWLVAGRGRSIDRRPIARGDLAFPHGCNFGVDRALFLQHRFDEAWRAGEEIELAYRLRAVGVSCEFEPSALVHYRYRSGFAATFRQARIAGRAQRDLTRLGDVVAASAPTARRVAWLIARAPRLATRSGRIRWAWVAGDLAGRWSREGPPGGRSGRRS